MKIADRIVIDPEICAGKPCIRGTRLTVDFILELLAARWDYNQIQEEYRIEYEDILAVLDYAHRILREEQIFSIST
jgi:uncharacterized protein (DUF433 family)